MSGTAQFVLFLVIIMLSPIALGLLLRPLRIRAVRPAAEELDVVRAQLLDAVVRTSNNQRTPVDIRPFWRRRRSYGTAARYVIVTPLIESGTLFVPPLRNDSVLYQFLRWLYLESAATVVLSDRDW